MFQAALLVCALVANSMLALDDSKKQQKDPPLRYEGVVSSVDKSNPNSMFLTIAVKEMMPTDREDVVIPVDKNYQFKVDQATKIIGLNGKPDKDGLKSLTKGTKVKIETKPKEEKAAVEIKIMPPN